MPNKKRKRSEFVLTLSDEQHRAFLKLAMKMDKSLEQVVLEAIDQYIETEKQTWKPKP